MLAARLSKDKMRVLCGVRDSESDCGCELAWVLEIGVYADGHWQRGVWFPPGWAARPDGVWALTQRATPRRQRRPLEN